MRSATFTVRVDAAAKKRLERLAQSTGRSRSFLAAEAINDYLDVNEWQIAGIKQAIASLDRGEGVSHEQVKDWITSRAAVASRLRRVGKAQACPPFQFAETWWARRKCAFAHPTDSISNSTATASRSRRRFARVLSLTPVL